MTGISLPPALLAAIAAAQGKAPTAPAVDPSSPMGSFAALAPAVLNAQSNFARPEAAAWLASVTGQQTPQWAMTPAQLEELKKANSRSRLPAPPKRPTAQTVKAPTPVQNYIGNGMFQLPANFQELIARYQAGQQAAIPAAGQTSGATNTTGPAPSAFAALNRFQGPFGNGGGGLNVQSILATLRGRIL